MPVRYVYFDLGNVLLNFHHGIACRQVAELTRVSPVLVRETIFESGLQEKYERGEITDDEFWRIVCKSADITIGRELLLRAVSDIFSPNVPVIPIVARLAAANYPLGILSNTCHGHWSWICQRSFSVVPKYFDNTVLSFEHGSMKPDARIYQEAIRRAGVGPREVFFVDDRLENVEGARRLGIDAVPFQDAQMLVRDLDRRGIRLNL